MMTPLPPHNLDAEMQILGSCMISRSALETSRALISDDDWYRPAHQQIWTAIRALHAKEIEVDPISVGAELTSNGKKLNADNGNIYLFDLVQKVVTAVNVEYHCRLVAAASVRRRLIEAGTRMAQRGYEMDHDLDKVLEQAKFELDLVARTNALDGQIPGLHTWGDFIATYANQPQHWVIPGFVGRKDVWMILAPPGAGKTTLSRQMCWGIAAGVHPFRTDRPITARRTLLIDLENDEGMAADESVDWYGRLDAKGEGCDDRAWIWSYPQGLNIRDPGHANLLDQVIGDTKPAFVALGSLYKAFTRSGDWDQAAGEARVVLDRMRARHQIAFWLEHHMPKSSDGGRRHTPFGSSVWEWWASHGRVLERAVDSPGSPFLFKASFRGDRRKAEAPVGFTRGRHIPWEPIWDEGELQVLMEACA